MSDEDKDEYDYDQDYDHTDDDYLDYDYSDHDQEICDYSWECLDFFECDDSIKTHSQEYCWIEECYNDCGEEYCNVFRTDESMYNENDGTYYWDTEECPVDPTEELANRAARTARVAEAFNDSFMTAFEQFCPDGECIGGSD